MSNSDYYSIRIPKGDFSGYKTILFFVIVLGYGIYRYIDPTVKLPSEASIMAVVDQALPIIVAIGGIILRLITYRPVFARDIPKEDGGEHVVTPAVDAYENHIPVQNFTPKADYDEDDDNDDSDNGSGHSGTGDNLHNNRSKPVNSTEGLTLGDVEEEEEEVDVLVLGREMEVSEKPKFTTHVQNKPYTGHCLMTAGFDVDYSEEDPNDPAIYGAERPHLKIREVLGDEEIERAKAVTYALSSLDRLRSALPEQPLDKLTAFIEDMVPYHIDVTPHSYHELRHITAQIMDEMHSAQVWAMREVIVVCTEMYAPKPVPIPVQQTEELLVNTIKTKFVSALEAGEDFIERQFRSYVRMFAITTLVLFTSFMAACATFDSANPFASANSAEQKAFAMYGTFVILQERGADIVKNRSLPLKVRKNVKKANKIAFPVAKKLRAMAVHVIKTRMQLKQGKIHPDFLKQSVIALDELIVKFGPMLTSMKKAVEGT